MKFIEVTKEDIIKKNRKSKNKELREELEGFIAAGYQYAKVSDRHYNNNNDLRRAIQSCIEYHDLPIAVFMYNGITYVERL
jgi:hypothetical protein